MLYVVPLCANALFVMKVDASGGLCVAISELIDCISDPYTRVWTE